MPPILYLGWDETGQTQLYQLEIGDEPKRLTDIESGVFDFAVAPDGKTIAFSSVEEMESSIWLLRNGRSLKHLLTCQIAECTQPIWAPDSQRLIYEKRKLTGNGETGAPYLHWLDTQSGETLPVLADETERGSGARLSPNGKWLSYVSPEELGVTVYNFEDDRRHFVPNEIGIPASWHPDSTQVVVPNLDIAVLHGDEGEDHQAHGHDFETAVYLFNFNIASRERTQISPQMSIDDSNVSWSPDGEWLVIGRKTPRTTSGRQLWLMRPNGSDSRALTNDLNVHYGPASWSGNGRYLLFQRFDLQQPDSDPSIWIIDLETGEMSEVAVRGMQPVWFSG